MAKSGLHSYYTKPTFFKWLFSNYLLKISTYSKEYAISDAAQVLST